MSESLPHRVAAEVRAEMARQGVRQWQLAAHLNLPQTAISRRLKGDITFDLGELEKVADFLGVPAAQLLAEPATTAAPTTT